MTNLFKPFLKWFGYTRRERRSSFILLIILVGVIGSRYLIPDREMELNDYSAKLVKYEKSSFSERNSETRQFNLTSFDPNLASVSELIRIGFTEKQASIISNYRNKGGKFFKPSDIRKIYGIDDTLASRIIPYIIIQKDTLSAAGVKPVQVIRTELNRCDSADLDMLPGIGPVLASRIIKYRKLLGGYVSVSQLKEVYGLSDSTYRLISGRLTADSMAITFIDINKAGFKELIRHPYFERYDVQAIIKFREIKGTIKSFEELKENKILTSEKSARVKNYLIF